MHNKKLLFAFSLLLFQNVTAQNVGINGSGATADPSAMLDITATNKGFLVPRIVLTSTTDILTIPTPATSLLVYNTATASAGATAIFPGYYYFDGTKWISLSGGSGGNDWSLLGNAGTVANTNFLGTTDAIDLVIRTNNTEKMRILSNGDIGMGIAVPSRNLHVFKDQNAGAKLAISNPNAGAGAFAQLSSDALGSTGYLYAMGSGYTTNNQFVAASALVESAGAGGLGLSAQAAASMRFYTNSGLERMRIQPNGFVGIATTTPAELFTVENGNIQLGENAAINTLGRNLYFGASNNNSDDIRFYRQNFAADNSDLNLSIGDNYHLGAQQTGDDKFNIGSIDYTGAFTGYRIGFTVNASASRVGINNYNPANTLEVTQGTAGNSGLRLTSLPNVRVLSTNATGDVVAATPSIANGLFWGLTGNSGTVATANFIGTTDAIDVVFRRSNVRSGLLGATNTGFGFNTLLAVTGTNNVALGASSLVSAVGASSNVAVGFQALNLNTANNNNTAVGTNALRRTIANNNTGIGFGALENNTTANDNTAMGYFSSNANTTGGGNVAVGFQALQTNTIGIDNTAVGSGALRSLMSTNATTNGGYNTAVGKVALQNVTNGWDNVGIGEFSGQTLTTGSENTIIGTDADVNAGAVSNASTLGNNARVNGNNATALGDNSIAPAANTVRIGNTTVTNIQGQVAYSVVSDGRFKSVTNNEVIGLEFIRKLRPVTYTFDTKKYDEFLVKNLSDDLRKRHLSKHDYSESSKIVHTGFIAQEVEKAALDAKYDFDGVHVPSNENDNYSVSYSQFVVPIVKSIQELDKQVDRLQKNALLEEQWKDKLLKQQEQIDILIKQNIELTKRLNAIERSK